VRWLRRTASMRSSASATYATQAKDTTLIVQATEIRMRAEHRCGELLIEMAARKERDSGKGNRNPALKLHAATPKLADLGISKTQSSRWQKLAALEQDQFEARIEGASKRAYDRIAQRFVKEAEVERAKQRHSKLIEGGCTVDDLAALAESAKRFSVIYADPPWPWGGNLGDGMSRADHHFPLKTLDAIKSLPVASLAAGDCALLLWCTGPHIAIGSHVEVIEAWGFKPSTMAFVWVKQNQSDGRVRTRGQGCWTTANAEFCFVATLRSRAT
jgi:MT-A70